MSAVRSLGKIHTNSALAVPALTRSLRDPDEVIRQDAVTGLASFGNEAKPAVPELTKSPC